MNLAPFMGSFFIILREGFEAMLIAMLIFTYLEKLNAQDKKQYVWPVAANTLSMAEAVKQRRQTRNRQKAIKNYASPKPANTPKRSRAKKRGTTAKAS